VYSRTADGVPPSLHSFNLEKSSQTSCSSTSKTVKRVPSTKLPLTQRIGTRLYPLDDRQVVGVVEVVEVVAFVRVEPEGVESD
jgi:hypothetical protein